MLSETSIMCFLSVARHLSFTKAAEEVFMSRQAVSKIILSLEKRLGVRLFDRTTNVIELTVDGRLYRDFFRKMVQDYEAFFETRGRAKTPSATLIIGYELGVIVDNRVIEIIGEFKKNRDNMDLKVRRYEPQVIESKLLNGQLNMAFTTIPKNSKIYHDFPHIALDYAEYVLVTSTNHPKVNENTQVTDFNGEQAVYWNMDNIDDSICRKVYNAIWTDIGITVIPSVQCTSLSSAYTELLLGNAVMLCNAKNELCTLPGITTYSFTKKEIFGCVWNLNAQDEILEIAKAFRKYEIKE